MVALLDLLEGVGIVVSSPLAFHILSATLTGACLRGHGDVAAVEDLRPAVEGVGLERDVVAATEPDFA